LPTAKKWKKKKMHRKTLKTGLWPKKVAKKESKKKEKSDTGEGTSQTTKKKGKVGRSGFHICTRVKEKL